MSDQDPNAQPGQPPVPPPVPPQQAAYPPPAAPPPPGYGQPAYPAPQGPYGQTPGYGGATPPAVPQNSTNALVALILAIASWVVCPLVCAIIALVFASKAKKEITDSNGWVTGSGMVTAAKVIAWINIVFSILLVAFYIVLFVIIGVSGGFDPNNWVTVTPTPTFSF